MRWLVLLAPVLLLLPAGAAADALAPNSAADAYLLTLEAGADASEVLTVLDRVGGRVLETFPVSGAALVTVPAGSADVVAQTAGVADLSPDRALEPLLDSSRRAAGLTPAVREAGVDGAGVTIVLVDSGIDQDHPALRDRVLADIAIGPDGTEQDAASSSDHGTHVAGVLVGTGAQAPSGRDLAGVAPGADLVSLDLSQQFTTSNALRAFEWIYQNHEEYDIRVVANSWGRQRDQATYDASDPLIRATDALVDAGLVVVFSAGNGGDQPGRMTLEATNPNVLTVGATTDGGAVEPYSSRGPVYDGDGEAAWTKPDLVAPGTRVVSAADGGRGSGAYVMMNGTSMAAPHVAGAAALLVSVRPDLTPGQVKGTLLESARDVEADGVDDLSGYGLLDIQAALRLLASTESTTVEHERVVAREEGRLTGPSQAGAVLQAASMQAREQVPFEVRENATTLGVRIDWTGEEALHARLLDPSGNEVRRAQAQGERHLRVQEPAAGAWTLVLESEGLGSGDYETEVTVAWEERRAGAGLPVDSWVRPSSGGFPMIGATHPFGPSLVPGLPNLVPVIGGTIVSALLLVGRFTRRW